MRQPEFWSKNGRLARALGPIGRVYGAVTAWRVRTAKPIQVKVPVLSVGNLTVGGTGKTPVTRDVTARLRKKGSRPAVVLRGYGGQMAGPVRVDPAIHTALDVGDEALLHAKDCPTWVSRNRALGAHAAVDDGASFIVLDDAHQHTSLKKDASVVVVDGTSGFGNHRIVPAGPLREDVRAGLARADLIAIMGTDATDISQRLPESLPALEGTLQPAEEATHLRGQRVVAFAGLGRPEKFYATLGDVGAKVIAKHTFDDHHLFKPADIQPILDEAFSLGAIPVTTEKDAARLTPDQRQQVNVLRVSAQWRSPAPLENLLDRLLSRG